METRPSLFREEAVAFQQDNRGAGHVAALQPLSTKVISWFVSAAFGVLVAFLLVGQYARKETVAGYLTPTFGTAKIFVPQQPTLIQQGTIKDIHVREGQLVAEGDPLLTVETSQIAVNGQDVNATMLESLISQQERLNKQIEAEQERGSSERERLAALIRGLESEVAALHSQTKSQSERIAISEQFVAAGTDLRGKGYMADLELKRRQLAVLEQRQNLDALGQQLAARQNQMTETTYALRQLPIATAEKIQALRNELSLTEQRAAEINGRRAYVLRAPTSGRISTVQATVGQFADPRRLQMEIIPAESALRAELLVPTRAAGFIRPGLEVRILYDAFPYQQFGTYTGRVMQVSQTILTGADASGPIAPKEPVYKVSAALDRADIDAYGKRIPLQADMLLRADILLEKRSLMQWLLDPLLRLRR
ncbi:HlyD family efflux transporter periplasmic adaptor subunit [Bradyrhizobium sp. CNPSo 4010]|uniref:HlyD family efflux transporter periplasmic adaptor subunit n=1 Tax=Bradyrhizobium agreste TaxID=2751811 RepID=A0ABS0PWP1_9BRAD|nr:HlyD family efflux transporter periplasmic adaptor subunit [Bradyrhizobium agreste]MBH5401625.1 HlyD family efflux transporter periplasmic adaptor subunit [Bradyrhizobium agreste]